METKETVTDFIFLGSKITAYGDCSHEIKRWLLLGVKSMTNLDSVLKSGDISCQRRLPTKLWFFSSHVRLWESDHKKGWALKNWCFSTVVLKKTLESPLDIKEIKAVNPKGNQLWIFIGRTDAKPPMVWIPDVKSWLIGKDTNARKDWGQERVGQQRMRWLDNIIDSNGHEFEQTPGHGEGQGNLACCRQWGQKQVDTT